MENLHQMLNSSPKLINPYKNDVKNDNLKLEENTQLMVKNICREYENQIVEESKLDNLV